MLPGTGRANGNTRHARQPGPFAMSPTSIFAPLSAPAESIFELSVLVLAIAAAIFVVVAALLVYSVVKFRKRRNDDGREPAQVYGSLQVELAWTITPVIIVLVLFLASARVVFAVQDAPRTKDSLEVTVVGHQFWWEYRYPGLKIVTANELHVPVGSRTFLNLLSADTDHSFWVPRLAGKTDLIPNHPNGTWIEPRETGLYLGQCAQYCGTQHAKMLLRVYVDSREDFDRWAREQDAARRAGGCSSKRPASTAIPCRERRRTAGSDPTSRTSCRAGPSAPVWRATLPRTCARGSDAPTISSPARSCRRWG